MNKFAEWMECNDKKQKGVATKLGICQSSLHEILKKNLMPSLKVAYEIEKYTNGAVTLYDWIDTCNQQPENTIASEEINRKSKKIKK